MLKNCLVGAAIGTAIAFVCTQVSDLGTWPIIIISTAITFVIGFIGTPGRIEAKTDADAARAVPRA
jgi:hypothetical protein